MKKRNKKIKTLLTSVCCLSMILSQNPLTLQAADQNNADVGIMPAYSEQNKGEGDRYTSDEDWVPGDLEKKVIQESKFADDRSIVYLIMADGFVDTKEDKAKFENEAKAMMEYLMKLSPYNEYEDVTKVYTIYTPSEESGASRDMDYADYKAALEQGLEIPEKDTFFRCAFNQLSYLGNYERLLEPSIAGMQRSVDIAEGYGIDYDQIIILSNSTRYGGSGVSSMWPAYVAEKADGTGTVTVPSMNLAVSSIHTASKEVAAHEIAHALGSLADEYWPGEEFAINLANMTDNPEDVPWKDFLTYSERTNCSIYSYESVAYGDPAGAKWFRPTNGSCKMQYLSTPTKNYEFCEVCREGFRESMSKFAGSTSIYWQDYCKNSLPVNAEKNTLDHSGYVTDFTYNGKAPEDIEKSFIVRHNGNVVENPEIGFTYFDENGNKLDSAPVSVGTYKVTATFTAVDQEMNDCGASKVFTISKAPLVATADNQTVEQGKDLPTATYTLTGFAEGDDASVLTENTLSADYKVADTSELGTSEITMSGTVSAENYELAELNNGTLTVVKASETPKPDDGDNAQTPDKDAPKTGDTSSIILWMAFVLLSVCVMVSRRFKRNY